MFSEEFATYTEIIDKANCGEPSAMFELAMLYECNVISSYSDEEYIYWLKRFLLSNQIQSIVEEFDDEDGTNNNGSFDFTEAYNYYPMIIEAGLALGLYYKNSSNIDEVRLASQALCDAFVVSRFDFIEVEDDCCGVTDILSLLSQANARITFLSRGAE